MYILKFALQLVLLCVYFISASVRKVLRYIYQPIAVAERSRARTVFARSNTAIVGSNPT
jgi:hypothetical protein